MMSGSTCMSSSVEWGCGRWWGAGVAQGRISVSRIQCENSCMRFVRCFEGYLRLCFCSLVPCQRMW